MLARRHNHALRVALAPVCPIAKPRVYTTRRILEQRTAHNRRKPFSEIQLYDLAGFVQRRTFSLAAIAPSLLPPFIFVSLVLTLWLYKCLAMIVFQNRIIYMPSVPPFSRRETIQEYSRECKPIIWEQACIRSLDGTRLALCIATNDVSESSSHVRNPALGKRRRVIILYLQGNASSLPPRLPSLSKVLQSLPVAREGKDYAQFKIIALSYRGFWTSSGRPSQKGIRKDVAAALRWIIETTQHDEYETRLVIWGQSIGAGIATTGLADLVTSREPLSSSALHISGLILETPFTSMKEMLISIYPQRWLPYRYLWPFLTSTWDNEAALRSIAKVYPKLDILLLTAGRDELVPPEHGARLVQLCTSLGLQLTRRIVDEALHTEIMTRMAGRQAVSGYLQRVCSSRAPPQQP